MSKREMTVEYLRGMVKKSFQNVEVDENGKMCLLPLQSLVDTVDLYEKKIDEQKAEIKRLTEEVESIANIQVESCKNCYKSKQVNVLEGHIKELKECHKERLAERQKVITALCDEKRELQKQVDKLTEQLEYLNWYKMWHNKFKKEIEDLTLELETYRPTKLSGNGQCKCSNCGVISWTNWFASYKGQTLCNNCLKKCYGVEVE